MSRKILGPALFTLVLGATAFAADFWLSKPYAEWSEKEVLKLLSNSPWAKPIDISVRSRKDTQAGLSADERFGQEGASSTRVLKATLVWNGRTVRMAQVRQKQIKGVAADAEKDKAFIDGPDKDFYVFVLQAREFQEMTEMTPEQFVAGTKLVIGGKKSQKTAVPQKVELPSEAKGSVAVFFFPREGNPITTDDKEVTFITNVGDKELSHGFDLADMMSDSNLDL